MTPRAAAVMVLLGLAFLGITAATFTVPMDHDVAQAFGLVGTALTLFFLGDGGLALWRHRRLQRAPR